jgi:D-glycero-alpha-D-manno-heptose 1-phosphate guanylyltransferase
MEVIILAGGMGTRLQSVIQDVPKPMAPIQNKPFLHYILTWLEKNNVTRAIISIGYKAEIIKKEFGNRFNSIDLIYSFEESPLGTGGAIALAMTKIKEDKIFIINGDSFFKVSLNKFMTFHCSGNFDFSVALKPVKKTDRYGTVEIDLNNKIVNFKEKTNIGEGLINGGVYILNSPIAKSFPSSAKFSFEEGFMAAMLKKLSFGGMIQNSYFIDIGIPEDYIRAQIELPAL